MLLDALKDIVKHTSGLGFIDMVKVLGTKVDAKIETIDADKTVVISGSMYQPIDGIDSTVGLSRMGVLSGFLGVDSFSAPTASVKVVQESRNGVDAPTEVMFNNGAGTKAAYRFMSEAMINDQVKVPPFKGATWDVTVTPTAAKLKELSQLSGILGGFEKRFVVSTAGGSLIMSIGTGPTDRTTMTFAENVTGVLKHQWSWPLAQVLAILKLSDTAASTSVQFSDMGALKIDIDSGTGKYSYILPAGKA
jgi:hypothetical protein